MAGASRRRRSRADLTEFVVREVARTGWAVHARLVIVAVWIGMLGLDFTVETPAALIDHLRVLAERYAAAVAGSDQGRMPDPSPAARMGG